MSKGRMNATVWKPIGKGSRYNVILLTFDRKVRESYRATLERRDDKLIVLRASAQKRIEVDDFVIDPGDQIRQYFPLNEWFYIQEYTNSKGRLKGWYCNVGTPPEVSASKITSRDLILDIFVDEKRRIKILDEDELREKQHLLRADELKRIEEARTKLVEMAEKRASPFDHRNTHPS